MFSCFSSYANQIWSSLGIWKAFLLLADFAMESLSPSWLWCMPMEPLWISHSECELTTLEVREGLEIKALTEKGSLWYIFLGYVLEGTSSQNHGLAISHQERRPKNMLLCWLPKGCQKHKDKRDGRREKGDEVTAVVGRQMDKLQVPGVLLPDVFSPSNFVSVFPLSWKLMDVV